MYIDILHLLKLIFNILKNMRFCKTCGKEVPINIENCSYCGSYVNNPDSTDNDVFVDSNQVKKRPAGISIISIFFIIGGILSILGISSSIQGIVSFAFGIAYIVIGWGLRKGKSWSWSGFIVLTVLGVLMSIVSIIMILMSPHFQQLSANNINNLIFGFVILISIEIGISLLLVYYFYRPNVKLFFGKS